MGDPAVEAALEAYGNNDYEGTFSQLRSWLDSHPQEHADPKVSAAFVDAACRIYEDKHVGRGDDLLIRAMVAPYISRLHEAVPGRIELEALSRYYEYSANLEEAAKCLQELDGLSLEAVSSHSLLRHAAIVRCLGDHNAAFSLLHRLVANPIGHAEEYYLLYLGFNYEAVGNDELASEAYSHAYRLFQKAKPVSSQATE